MEEGKRAHCKNLGLTHWNLMDCETESITKKRLRGRDETSRWTKSFISSESNMLAMLLIQEPSSVMPRHNLKIENPYQLMVKVLQVILKVVPIME